MKSLIVATLISAFAATAVAAVNPPVAPRQAKDVTIHGDPRSDDWFWLRDVKDPRVLTYLKAENAHADAWFKPHQRLTDRLYREMLGRIQQSDRAAPYRDGAWWYASRTLEGKQYPVLTRQAAQGADRAFDAKAPEQMLLDLNALAKGKSVLQLASFDPSPDGKLLAYSIDQTGARDNTLFVKDLDTGKTRKLPLPPVDSHAWAANSRTLFFVTHDDTRRSHRLWRHRLGEARPSELLIEEKDVQFSLFVSTTADRRYVVVNSGSKDANELQVIDATQPDAKPRMVFARRSQVQADLEHRDGRFYLRVNDTGRNFRLVSVDAAQPDLAQATELIAARADVMLERLTMFRDHLVVTERDRGNLQLRVLDRAGGGDHLIGFEEAAYTALPGEHNEYDGNTLRFAYTSLTTPQSTFAYDLAGRQRTLLKREPVRGGYDPALYQTQRVHATAPDGTQVPISMVWRKDLRRAGPQPLLLYGYGSYGLPMDPEFRSTRLSLLDRGAIFAMAHIRGGGELGKTWYEAGKLQNKQNTFTDFIASAEHLIKQGYTQPSQLVIWGGSAGGLLMGAVVNQRPELFKAVVADVPFVDVINTMLDESIPLTTAEFTEWGNPKLPEQYAWMRAYSPYDNLKAGAYPAMLLEAGLNDSQVPYWEAAKYTARLRTLKTDDNPLLLHTNLGAGHGGASGRFDAIRELARTYTFMLNQMGLAEGK